MFYPSLAANNYLEITFVGDYLQLFFKIKAHFQANNLNK